MSVQKTGFRVRGAAGFTLIEVLAAMAVLVVLVLALTRMFMESASITRRGLTAVMRNSAGETAMETLLQDTEGMAVNERIGCYVEANVTDPAGFGFDDVWFITTSGDQDDGRAYQMMHYYVLQKVSTNALGAPYQRNMLYRDLWILAVADHQRPNKDGLDVLSTNTLYNIPQTRWWSDEFYNNRGQPDQNMLADNVVRFDVYCLGWDGEDWMRENAGKRIFDSTRGPVGFPEHKNKPPAAFDVYLQITSPEVAVESGMALVPGVDAATQQKAREKMIRESATILGRASPIIGAAQYQHPVNHYAN